MSIFSNILEKLGLKRPAATAAPSTPPAAAQSSVKPPASMQAGPKPTAPTSAGPRPPITTQPVHLPRPMAGDEPLPPAGIHPAPIPVVDVVNKLEKLAAAKPQKLDWKVSIVDLLKLLDIDSSYAARKELAIELGCPPEKMGDSAQMNTWLHKTVLQKIAENGGNVPKELLD